MYVYKSYLKYIIEWKDKTQNKSDTYDKFPLSVCIWITLIYKYTSKHMICILIFMYINWGKEIDLKSVTQ